MTKYQWDDTRIKHYLSEIGQRERDELRAFYATVATDPATRHQALVAQDNLILFLNGFFYCMELGLDEGVPEYYRQFFDQARSEKGLDNGG